MRMVVTGGAGFIGSHLCEALAARGDRVVAIDALSRADPGPRAWSRAISAEGLAFHHSDVRDEGCRDLLDQADAVVHLAGRGGARLTDRAVLDEANVAPTIAVLHAAAAAGIRRVVLASSSSVYGSTERPRAEGGTLDAQSPYAQSKLSAEREAAALAEALGVELVILRYFSVYGPRQRPDMAFARYIEAAASGAPMPIYGGLGRRRQFTYVGDAVRATLAALDRGVAGTIYNVAGPASETLGEALRILGALIPGPPPPLIVQSALVPEPDTTWADLSRAATGLGWTPSVTLREGLEQQVAASGLGEGSERVGQSSEP